MVADSGMAGSMLSSVWALCLRATDKEITGAHGRKLLTIATLTYKFQGWIYCMLIMLLEKGSSHRVGSCT